MDDEPVDEQRSAGGFSRMLHETTPTSDDASDEAGTGLDDLAAAVGDTEPADDADESMIEPAEPDAKSNDATEPTATGAAESEAGASLDPGVLSMLLFGLAVVVALVLLVA